MAKILFVCTGNVFRSMSAELALKSADEEGRHTFSSAGTHAILTQPVRAETQERLKSWGADSSGHKPRLLTADMIKEADLVVAMGTDHRDFIEKTFGVRPVLFMKVAQGMEQGIPDLNEAIPDYRENREGSKLYIHGVVDLIFGNQEEFMERLPQFLKIAPAPKLAAKPPNGRPPSFRM
ncbi:MAG: hypothetical protein EPN97_06770 [Alphaproteobacteria bacterium]|nr:MAG: hypothetical protein EPN97_06770 [Alphaproteobacteria bacterium]